MTLHVRQIAVLLSALFVAGCNSAEDRLRDEVKEEVTANLADRKDISESDKEAAAEVIAEDVVQLKREFEEIQPQIDENNRRLERERPSLSELKARDCEQRRLELEALQRLSQDPTSLDLDPSQRDALPEEIRRAETELAERCGVE
jgi:capsule polysaccharide export protein KpsE/RkpR